MKDKISNKLEDLGLAKLLAEINENWVKKLNRLRGSIIHNQAEVGGLEFSEKLSGLGIEHNFNFPLPEAVIRGLPIFSDSAKISIEPGTALIALHTINNVRRIIDAIGKFEYKCVYDPHQA